MSRYIVRSGLLGEVRWVDSYYIQGWLATKLEATGQQQAAWRVDPKRAGGSGCGGDIGTHALMQLRYVTGLDVTAVSAQLETFVEGRQLDDHFTIYCKLSNGGKALVRASQICIGHKNDLGIVIAGTKGTLRWRQEEPECLTICLPNQPDRTYWRGAVTPGDGFLPKDMPADLMAEPTIPSGPPGSLPRRLRAAASLFRGRRAPVEGRREICRRRHQIRQHRGRLDGHRLHRNLRQEQRQKRRLDPNAQEGLIPYPLLILILIPSSVHEAG